MGSKGHANATDMTTQNCTVYKFINSLNLLKILINQHCLDLFFLKTDSDWAWHKSAGW